MAAPVDRIEVAVSRQGFRPDHIATRKGEPIRISITTTDREHCFDPFYCGRSAGRGRGLGLPTAWQFARQNGGDVRHEPTADGPTRFVLTVPRSITLEFLDRQSA